MISEGLNAAYHAKKSLMGFSTLPLGEQSAREVDENGNL
jgi:hypothetical protein